MSTRVRFLGLRPRPIFIAKPALKGTVTATLQGGYTVSDRADYGLSPEPHRRMWENFMTGLKYGIGATIILLILLALFLL